MQNTFYGPLPESIHPPATSACAEVGHFRWMLNLAGGLQNGRTTIQNTEDFLPMWKSDILNFSSLAENISHSIAETLHSAVSLPYSRADYPEGCHSWFKRTAIIQHQENLWEEKTHNSFSTSFPNSIIPLICSSLPLLLFHCPGFGWDRGNFPSSSCCVLNLIREKCW